MHVSCEHVGVNGCVSGSDERSVAAPRESDCQERTQKARWHRLWTVVYPIPVADGEAKVTMAGACILCPWHRRLGIRPILFETDL